MTEADVVDIARRIHARDVSLWAAPEAQSIVGKRLGWLDAPDWLNENREELTTWARDIRGQGFARVVVLGMGGRVLRRRPSPACWARPNRVCRWWF